MTQVRHYFFNFIGSQEKWLNEMANRGKRLVRCSQITYFFEDCKPGEYEYAVEFVADKSYPKSKDYKAFLEEMGYRTFYKNINVGIFVGKVKWRPWGEGTGKISTSPGSFQKELIIVEKKRDGKPFRLHTDLADSLSRYEKIRNVYLWLAGCMFIFVPIFILHLFLEDLDPVWFGLLLASMAILMLSGCLRLFQALAISRKIKLLREKAETYN